MNLPNMEYERIKHGLSKKDLASMLGVSRRTLKNWQDGITEIPSTKLIIMAKMWGCSVDHLLGYEKDIGDKETA